MTTITQDNRKGKTNLLRNSSFQSNLWCREEVLVPRHHRIGRGVAHCLRLRGGAIRLIVVVVVDGRQHPSESCWQWNDCQRWQVHPGPDGKYHGEPWSRIVDLHKVGASIMVVEHLLSAILGVTGAAGNERLYLVCRWLRMIVEG
jgi:hypothetical protein